MGTALKPAVEFIVLARKPLAEKNVAANVAAWGTGAINVDGGRIGTDEEIRCTQGQSAAQQRGEMYSGKDQRDCRPFSQHGAGRWPSNVALDEEAAKQMGEASRYFYTAKASPEERELGGNNHPTLKPLALMKWLLTLVAPPGSTILDPFAGSGTTLVAARDLGLRAIGIEREADYCEIARKRLAQLAFDMEPAE